MLQRLVTAVRARVTSDPVLATRAFFAGLVVGLVCLSVLGRLVSQQPPLENFSRFAPILSPTALFYPTASEAVALARNSASPDEILVIVGGSSVARGDGQSTGNLWSRRLEEQLGPPYR